MASSPKAPADPIDARLVRKLADILTETGLTEIEVEHNDLKIRVAKTLTAAPAAVYAPAPVAAAAPAAAPAAAAPVAPAAAAVPVDAVKSPMVGTAYLSAEPGATPFVAIGQQVKEGETLMIVEAMKTMNHIPAPRAGTVKRILVSDGHPVEYGAPLMIIE